MSSSVFFKELSKGLANTLLNGFKSDLPASHGPTFVKAARLMSDNYIRKPTQLKCFGLFLGTLVIQPVGLAINIVNRALKVVTFAHFWWPCVMKCLNGENQDYTIKASCKDWGVDLLRILASPFIFLGMLGASGYGMVDPEKGARLYAYIEGNTYSGGQQRFAILDSGKHPHWFILIGIGTRELSASESDDNESGNGSLTLGKGPTASNSSLQRNSFPYELLAEMAGSPDSDE